MPERNTISEFTQVRRLELLPQQSLRFIYQDYQQSWAPEKERSLEGSETAEYLKRALWIQEHRGNTTNIIDILKERVENVVRGGDVFRIMDVGSSSYATLFTGQTSKELEMPQNGWHTFQPRGVVKNETGLEDILKMWGFEPEKHFELIAVHGGQFAISEKPGLRLITANIFEKIPQITEQSINLLTCFRCAYQTFGGFYLIEYFDRLLKKSRDDKKKGVGIVWPFEDGGNGIIVIDQDENPLNFKTLFDNLDTKVGYFDDGRHVHWKTESKKYLRFPLKPFVLLEFPFSQVLVYKLEDGFAGKGNMIYHDDHAVLQKKIDTAQNAIYFQ